MAEVAEGIVATRRREVGRAAQKNERSMDERAYGQIR